MTIAHKDVSASNIHECKGANTASVDTVRISDGAGSGTWAKIPPASITGVNNINKVCMSIELTDISTPASYYIVIPIAGVISKFYTVIESNITGSNAGIALYINGVAVTNGTITVTQSGSAAGDIDSCTPTAANIVTAGQAIEVRLDGASSGTCRATGTFLIDVS